MSITKLKYLISFTLLVLAVFLTPFSTLPAAFFNPADDISLVDLDNDKESQKSSDDELPKLIKKVTHCQSIKLSPKALYPNPPINYLHFVVHKRASKNILSKTILSKQFCFSCTGYFKILFRYVMSPNGPPKAIYLV